MPKLSSALHGNLSTPATQFKKRHNTVLQPAYGYHTTPAKPQRNTNTHRTTAIQPTTNYRLYGVGAVSNGMTLLSEFEKICRMIKRMR